MDSPLPTSEEAGAAEAPRAPETFGMGDTLASGRSEAVAIKLGRNKHGKGGRRAQQLAVSPMVDESKQLVALTAAKAKRTRHPRNGPRDVRGNPKKGGGGGKGTWGKITDVMDGMTAEDREDPNYDPAEEGQVVMRPIRPPLDRSDIAGTALPIFKEFCSHGDTQEVIEALVEFNIDSHRDAVVYCIIEYALENHNNVRELASILLSDMMFGFLAPRHVEQGFRQLLHDLPELTLDTPDAADVLSKFIARAIGDECIPPAYLSDRSGFDDNDLARITLDHAAKQVSIPHAMTRLHTIWGSMGGGLRPVKHLEQRMEKMLSEFLASNDQQELERCLHELDVPHFHHEFVYLAIMLVLESGKSDVTDPICSCLGALGKSAIITTNQMERGFTRIYDALDDIQLDVPYVYQVMSGFAQYCLNENVISSELYDRMPRKVRRRFVSDSEGDTHVEVSNSPN